MVKLLSTIVLILAIILFPPAALAVISNNAVPGDSTYPIKRTLEDGIYAIVSLNPTTQAWFSAARSDRRFKEVTVLLAQGKVATETLDELVSQTETAAEEIKKITDPVKKKELISQLTQQIEKYDQGLSQASQKAPSLVDPTLPPAPTSVSTPPATPHVSPRSTTSPRVTPSPQSTISPTRPPTPAPIPSIPPAPPPVSSGNDVDEAIDKLERIKDELEGALEDQRDNNQNDRNQNSNNRENSGRGNENRDRNNNSNSGRNRD